MRMRSQRIEYCFRCGDVVDGRVWYVFVRRDPYSGIVRLLTDDEWVDVRERGTTTERLRRFRHFGYGFGCVCARCGDALDLGDRTDARWASRS
jgi:hypothetical protein